MGRNYPLNSLRAFESAGRQLSFLRAADELFVTPAAISQQVKRLESHLNTPLFKRLPRGLLLTDAGQSLLRDLTPIFEALDTALERAQEDEAQGALTISVAPMFATKWLVPRMELFDRAHPKIDLRISSSLELVDFGRTSFDAAIRLGNGAYAGLTATRLFDEALVPMCSPTLLQTIDQSEGHLALRHMTLLHNDSIDSIPDAPDWQSWLAQAGIDDVDASRGPRFSQPDHAIQAAIDGAGVVLGWCTLAQQDIEAGRLIPLSNQAIPLGAAFHLVYPSAYATRTKVVLLRDWLLGEIHRGHQRPASV